MGAVVRDKEGVVKVVGVQQSSANWEVRVAEAKAVMCGLWLAANPGLREVIIKSYCFVNNLRAVVLRLIVLLQT